MRSVLSTLLFATLYQSTTLAHPNHDTDLPTTQPSIPVLALLTDDGALALKNLVTVEIRDGYRYITSNGIPDHEPGQFPNRGNPNAISAQKYEFRVPANPKPIDAKAGDPKGDPNPGDPNRPPRAEGPQLFGVAINGVPFDPGTAEFWRDDRRLGWRMEAIGGPRNLGLDQNNAHVQPNGAYHYHAVPTGLVAKAAGDAKARKMVLIGWAADGFPLYGPFAYEKADDPKSDLKAMKSSWQLRKGQRPAGDEGPGGKFDGAYTRDWEFIAGSGDLDECNGRTGVTPEFPAGTYYYVITDTFPFIPRQFKGTPDPSFTKRGPRPGEPGGPGGRGPGGRGPGPGGRGPGGPGGPPPP